MVLKKSWDFILKKVIVVNDFTSTLNELNMISKIIVDIHKHLLYYECIEYLVDKRRTYGQGDTAQ